MIFNNKYMDINVYTGKNTQGIVSCHLMAQLPQVVLEDRDAK
jgi:hypothetical protein